MGPADMTHPDVTLRLDLDGTIRSVTVSNALDDTGTSAWVGMPWRATVAEAARQGIDRLLLALQTGETPGFQRVIQQFPNGEVHVVEYTLVRLNAGAGVLAIGRGVEAVTDLEQRVAAAEPSAMPDVERLRSVEAWYRANFDLSSEAILVLRAADLVVLDANPAAVQLLGGGFKGREITSVLAASDRVAVRKTLADVREHGTAFATALRRGADKLPWEMRGTLVKGATETSIVLHIMERPLPGSVKPAGRGGNMPFALEDLVQRLPEALVVTDMQGNIQLVNASFLEMTQVGVANAAIGQGLGRWLRGLGADQKLLTAKLLRYGIVRRFRSVIEGELGTEIPVDVSGAVDSTQHPAFLCLMIRDATGQEAQPGGTEAVETVLASLADQVGERPLRDLVQDTVKVLERHYIQAALRLTGGNRTAAADMLGLSRQSLYVKLNRYGLDPTTVEGDGYAY